MLEIQVPKPAANQLTAVGLLVRIPASAGAESSSRIPFAQGRVVEMRVLDQLLSEHVQGERDVGGDSIQSAQDIDVACIGFSNVRGLPVFASRRSSIPAALLRVMMISPFGNMYTSC